MPAATDVPSPTAAPPTPAASASGPPSRPAAGSLPALTSRWLQTAERCVLIFLVTAMVALVLGHRYLPMNDAPSHTANAVIVSGLWHGDPFFAEHYQLQSVPLPYWAVALSMFVLQLVLPPLLSFRVLVALYVVLLPLAFIAVLRAAGPAVAPPASATPTPRSDGNRPLAAVAALAAMNWAYFLGEANFFLGQPLLLFALALFLRPFPLRSGRLLGFVLLATAVYLCHIYALTALCGAIFAYALQQLIVRRRLLLSAGQWAAAGYLAALFFLGAYFVLFAHGTDANTGGTWAFDFSLRKAAHLLIDPFDSPSSPSRPVLLGFVAGLGLLLLVPWLKARPGLRSALGAALYWPLLAPALLLFTVAFLGPVGLLHADGTLKEGEIAMRLLLAGWMLLLGGVRLPPGRWVRPALLALTLGFGLFKLHDAYRLHQRCDERVRAVSATLLAQVPRNSRLLPLMDLTPDEAVAADFLYHRIGNYVVVDRHGYSPHVFAVLGQHPLRHRHRGDYRQVSELTVSEDEWRFYDYLLVQSRRPESQSRIAGLHERADLVAATLDFRLYRIHRGCLPSALSGQQAEPAQGLALPLRGP